MNVIELVDGCKQLKSPDRGRLNVLVNATLHVAKGETVAVIGKSGSGKTTLLNVVGLIEPLTSGTLAIGGQDVGNLSRTGLARLRGQFFGFVYQRFCLLDHLSAVENVELPLMHAGWTSFRDRHRAASVALGRVGLADRARHRPSQLSGGEQQRVAIARALVRQTQVILADEPLGALDDETGASVSDLLFSLVGQQGIAMVVVTHDKRLAQRCDRVVRIERGELSGP